MLNETELIAYLENTLSPAERRRVEAELERDPLQRRQLVRQIQLDAALRASLGGSEANERVKQSVLAVTRGETEAAIKQHVLNDTTFTQRRAATGLSWLASLIRRPALAFSLAAACLAVFLGLWFAARPAPIALAIETPVHVARFSGSIVPKTGDTIRTEDFASATVKFADGTILHLEPGTEIRFQAVAALPRGGGKQLKLIFGSLSADVAKQAASLPLRIETPHALLIVLGTEFDLSVATNQTALEVAQGLVKMTGAGEAQPVSVAAGEFAVASSQAAMQYGRLARNPYRWPFSSASIWNRPLGSGARFAPVPGRPFLADGSLQGALRPRRPFMGSPGDPLRQIFVSGDVRADVRLAGGNLPGTAMVDSLVLLQRARRYAIELRGMTVRPDGDLEATDAERVWLNGPGFMLRGTLALPFGLSNLGGLLRGGELESGIRHALSARVSRDRLAGRTFSNPATVWPAAGNPATDSDAGNLCVGTLLALPPGTDIAALVGDIGPAYELARAMQDYGVYLTGFTDAPFVLLSDTGRIPGTDEWLTKLVPFLHVVTNNSPATPAGGGTPRREPAPALPGETP